MSTHPEQAPLSGRWHHGGGNLCCGSLRIARADFDTNPSDAVQAEVLDWIVATLNAALTPQAPAEQPEAATPEQPSVVGASHPLVDPSERSDQSVQRAAGVGAVQPVAVVEWFTAFREYLAAADAYRARAEFARTQLFGEVDCDEQYQAYTEAHNKAHRLLRPMYDALAATPPVESVERDAADELERKKAANEWDNFNDVVPTLKAARDGSWQWYRNMRCKYIELRIDMRDLGCIIKDREGERITVSQLQHQHPPAAADREKQP